MNAFRLSTLILVGSFLLLPNRSSKAQSIQEEARPLVVMNLAAHPDDEDGSTLAYYRHVKNAIAYSVIYTRGEGGQNEIGPELYEALGALRTEETERAARILGTQVHFLNFKDFGYSKFAHEAFEQWGGEDNVTSRLVYLIRKLKPDVMFTNHDTLTVGPRTQHGQHQAVGVSAYNAFELASDPGYHPEQLDEPGVDLWQPKRLFLRLWRGPADGSYDVRVPVEEADPKSGKPAAQIAMEALSEHASQGMDFFVQQGRARWRSSTYFVQYRSATEAPLDTLDLAGNLEPNQTAQPDLTYRIDSGRLPTLPEGAVTVDKAIAVPGETVSIQWDPDKVPTELPGQASLVGAPTWNFEAPEGSTIKMNAPLTSATLTISETARPTLPKVDRQYDRFTSGSPIRYTLKKGEQDEVVAGGYLPLEIAPALLLEPVAEMVRLTPEARTINVTGRVYAPWITGTTVDLELVDAAGKTWLKQQSANLSLKPDNRFESTFEVALPEGAPTGDYTVQITARPYGADKTYEEVTLDQPARVFNARVADNLKVGVIESYDNTLSQALTELGVDYTLLDSVAIAEGAYPHLNTILVDIRAYLVRQDLRVHNDKLLDWVHRGGHLIVNYQKVFEWNAQFNDPFDESKKNPGDYAPYPLELGRDRVTYEDAPVTVLVPDHALFHQPNAIQASDWDGWVQERGLYFPETYDPAYTELFSMHDPGEDPLTSSSLLATYGEGSYIYTALGWYRQLKVFHPGAYRMFANMISLPLMEDRDVGSSY